MTITHLSAQLCGHMAAALANHLVQMEGPDRPARKGDNFYHSFQTDFTMAEAALERIGVYLPQTEADGTERHVFVVDASDMPEFLANSIKAEDDRFADLIEAFLRVACGYGGLSSAEDWFTPPPNWGFAMKHLAASGFALVDGVRFRWTEKVAPAMQSAGLWNEAGRSLEVLRALALEGEADLAWSTMPSALRESIQSSRINFIELVKVLALSWRDGAWHQFDRDSPVELSNQVGLARALIARAHAT